MPATLLTEAPLAPSSDVGPYRREHYDGLPEEPRCELLYGRLYVSPSPSVPHQVLVGLLWQLLDRIAIATGGMALMAPVDVPLSIHSVVQPDVLYLAAASRPRVGERIEGVVPDLVVEVVSPGTARRDRGEKLQLYAEAGVREYWLLEPRDRQIDFLVNRGGDFVVILPRDLHYHSPVLPEISLDLAAFWQSVAERLGEP